MAAPLGDLYTFLEEEPPPPSAPRASAAAAGQATATAASPGLYFEALLDRGLLGEAPRRQTWHPGGLAEKAHVALLALHGRGRPADPRDGLLGVQGDLYTFLGEDQPPTAAASSRQAAAAPGEASPGEQLRRGAERLHQLWLERRVTSGLAGGLGGRVLSGPLSQHLVPAARPQAACDGDLYTFMGEDGQLAGGSPGTEGDGALAMSGVARAKQLRLYGGVGTVWYRLARRRRVLRGGGGGDDDAEDPACEYHRMGDGELPAPSSPSKIRAKVWDSDSPTRGLGSVPEGKQDWYHELADADMPRDFLFAAAMGGGGSAEYPEAWAPSQAPVRPLHGSPALW